jgi:Zn-dependent protease with chaperone function
MGIYGLVKLTEFLSVSYIPSELLPTRSIFTVVSVVFIILFIHTYVYLQGSKCIIKWYKAQKIQESEKSYLFSILEDLSTKAKVKSPELHSFDSEIPSIFTVGTTRNPSIVISTSMLKTFDNLEMEALIAHEFGHIKCGHIYTNTLVALVAGTIMSFPNFVMSFSTILGFGQPEDPIPRVFEFYATALTAPIAAIIINIKTVTVTDKRAFSRLFLNIYIYPL